MSGSVPPRDGTAASPDVSVIIVSHNSEYLLPRTLAALQAGCGRLRLQIVVVDNASRDRSAELLKRDFPNVELIENATNLGFGRANNQAMSRARGRYILLLNPDALVSPDTLAKTVGFMDDHRRSGVLGVKLVDESGHVQPSVFRFPTPWNVFVTMSRLDRLVGGESTKLVKRDLGDNRRVPALLAESEFLYYRKHHGIFVVFASLFFTILTDFGRALKRLIVTHNQGLAPMSHLWTVLQVFVRTRMGSRPVH